MWSCVLVVFGRQLLVVWLHEGLVFVEARGQGAVIRKLIVVK